MSLTHGYKLAFTFQPERSTFEKTSAETCAGMQHLAPILESSCQVSEHQVPHRISEDTGYVHRSEAIACAHAEACVSAPQMPARESRALDAQH